MTAIPYPTTTNGRTRLPVKHMAPELEAAAVAAIAQADEALLHGVVTLAGYASDSLRDGDDHLAKNYAEMLRDSLASQPDAERPGVIRTLNAWLEANAGEQAHVLRELFGIEAAPPQPTDSLGDGLVRSLIDKGATCQGSERDALVGEAFGVVATLPELAVGRWRAEFGRVLDIRPREFDRLLKAARAGQRPDQAPESRRVPTHDELAERWRVANLNTVFVGGDYRRYSAGHWPVVSEDSICAEIKCVVEAAKPEGVRPTAPMIASVCELARLSVREDDPLWDADPDLLVLTNGTLRLSTGELRPHSPADRITTALDYAYDLTADCPTFRAFLAQTIPDAADFLVEFAGYCLTTDTKHEIAVWLAGPRGSGKSTLIEAFLAMLGPRVGHLGLADVERSSFALSNLPGKTLVVASEQPADFIRSGHVLNAIISGETVNVDRKFRDPIAVTPRAKLLWAMNDLPRITEAGSGLFRRVKVIRFPALAESARDPGLKQRIRAESAGFLNWAVEGLRRLKQRGGFEIPECVKGATDDFQRRNDVPALFLAECCLAGDGYRTQSSTLYSAYKAWCLENGHRPQSSTALADEWGRLGLVRMRPGGVTFWRGVGLIAGRSDD